MRCTSHVQLTKHLRYRHNKVAVLGRTAAPVSEAAQNEHMTWGEEALWALRLNLHNTESPVAVFRGAHAEGECLAREKGVQ